MVKQISTAGETVDNNVRSTDVTVSFLRQSRVGSDRTHTRTRCDYPPTTTSSAQTGSCVWVGIQMFGTDLTVSAVSLCHIGGDVEVHTVAVGGVAGYVTPGRVTRVAAPAACLFVYLPRPASIMDAVKADWRRRWK